MNSDVCCMEVELSAEAKDKRINRLVAITVVVLSVATGPRQHQGRQYRPGDAQAQANSLDRWNEYQATRTKLHVVETARRAACCGGRRAAEPSERRSPTFDADRAKYNAESPKLAEEAHGFSDEYDALNVHDDQFDASRGVARDRDLDRGGGGADRKLGAARRRLGDRRLRPVHDRLRFAGWPFHPDVLSTLLG